MKRAVIALILLCAASAAIAQPQGGVLRVRLTNGTTGERGSAEKVTLFRLRSGMEPAKQLEGVSGTFEIADIEVEGETPMLLQATYLGVNYNEPIHFGRGYEAEAEITVYELLSEWNDKDLELKTARFVYRRDGETLLVDKIFVVENRTAPKKTYHDSEGSFRFVLPTTGLTELHSVSARGESGMPVPQQASMDPNGRGYVTKTAFKPGETELVVSYEVDYANADFRVGETAFLPVTELYAFIAPPDITVEAEGWEALGAEPQGAFRGLSQDERRDWGSPRARLVGRERTSALHKRWKLVIGSRECGSERHRRPNPGYDAVGKVGSRSSHGGRPRVRSARDPLPSFHSERLI